MRRAWILALGLLLAPLQGCGTGAPSAPMGFDRHPANSAATLAGLRGEPRPVAQLASAPNEVSPAVPSDRASAAGHPMPNRITIFVVSDFTSPGGLAAWSPDQRAQLLKAARTAQGVTLLCRGDQTRPSRVYRRALIRRGIEVKRFLVSEGIAAGRIRIFARSAGAFVADNNTSVGRARNRRVEIHLV